MAMKGSSAQGAAGGTCTAELMCFEPTPAEGRTIVAEQWTQEDREEWNRLNSMDEIDRSPLEEVQLRGLLAKRELVAMHKENVIRKSGPLYKVGLVLMVAGVGSCLGGLAGGGGGLIGLGVVLVLAAAGANGLNGWLSRG